MRLQKYLRRYLLLGLLALINSSLGAETVYNPTQGAGSQAIASNFDFPTIPKSDVNARALAANTLKYLSPEADTIEPISGYPYEGWNKKASGMNLHGFTQLTAIGEYLEILAEIAVGHAGNPYLSKEEALKRLTKVVATLRKDQKDPTLSSRGLLLDFPIFDGEKRVGSPASRLYEADVLKKFPEQGAKLWAALVQEKWVEPSQPQGALVARGNSPWLRPYQGAMKIFDIEPLKTQVKAMFMERVPKIVFGDNANLSTSIGKTIGALLAPELKNDPQALAIRQELDAFLEDQKGAYQSLVDAKTGLFFFGYEGAEDHHISWGGKEGLHDYFGNEFRNPTQFLVTRFDLPKSAINNLGFHMKPYPMPDGKDAYTLAGFDGSGFQVTGLGLAMPDLKSKHWKEILQNFVSAMADYCSKKNLPGFLSESYRKFGEYTPNNGVPELALTAADRYTDASSFYSMGPSYNIAPKVVEAFLKEQWPQIEKLLTNHGPWEGFNQQQNAEIPVQTTAHTLSLMLGLLGTGSDNMEKYVESKNLTAAMNALYKPGQDSEWLSNQLQANVPTVRHSDELWLETDARTKVEIKFSRLNGVSLSNGELILRYESNRSIKHVEIGFEPPGGLKAGLMAKGITTHFISTAAGEVQEIRVRLPPTTVLEDIGGLSIGFDSDDEPATVKLKKITVEQN